MRGGQRKCLLRLQRLYIGSKGRHSSNVPIGWAAAPKNAAAALQPVEEAHRRAWRRHFTDQLSARGDAVKKWARAPVSAGWDPLRLASTTNTKS